MQDAVQTVLTNVERFLRWLYPGLLLLALLHLGRDASLVTTLRLDSVELSLSVQIFILVAAVIVSSFVVYALQRYLVHELFFQYFLGFFLLRRGDAYNYYAQRLGAAYTESPWRQLWRRHPLAFWEASSRLDLSSLGVAIGRYRDNRAYAWGVTHAIGLSSWLILLAAFYAKDPAPLSNVDELIVSVGSLLGLAWLFQEARNIFPALWADPNVIRASIDPD